MYIRIANLKKAKSRKPSDMHIRIANLRRHTPGNIGYAHSGCQSRKAKPRQPSDMHIRIANLKKTKPRKPSRQTVEL